MKLKEASVQNEARQEIHTRVAQKTRGRIEGLQVEIVKDTVILTGSATTYYSKQLATEAVRAVEVQFGLSNEIQVQSTT